MEAQRQAVLCHEIELELRELSQECRRRYPTIREYVDRCLHKVRYHADVLGRSGGTAPLPEFPLDEVLRTILMASETFQSRVVLLSLGILQRLVHGGVLKDETIAIVINLMKEQATNGEEAVQLKVLQTIMATPSHLTLLNELVVEQLMQLLYVLHNAPSVSVHHTACAGLRQLAEGLADRASATVVVGRQPAPSLEGIRPVIRRAPAAVLPTVAPAQAPATLAGPLRIFYIFVQDLCVMADYDASSLSSRYAVDAGERMRTGSREGFWLSSIKFPRPLCLELLSASVAAHPEIFTGAPECFVLLRHNICAALLKNLRGCFDFAILIRCIHLLQQIFKSPEVAALLAPELQVFLHLMLDLTTAERSPWQRATSLEFLKSICEDPAILSVLYDAGGGLSGSPTSSSGQRTYLELVNSLSKLIHQVCFSAGIDSGALLQSATTASAVVASSSTQRTANFEIGRGFFSGGVSLLDKAGLFGGGAGSARDLFGIAGAAVGPDGSATGSLATGVPRTSGSTGTPAVPPRSAPSSSRVKLLLLMSETEPPVIQPSFLVSVVVESVFAIVSSLYRLLLGTGDELLPVAERDQVEASGSQEGANHGWDSAPLAGPLTPTQERCRGMLSDSWASLLSALSLLLHSTSEEASLQQALRCLQTLLYCCGRLSLDQARDACLLQLSRYALPGPCREAEADSGSFAGGGPTGKNALCFKALLHFCYCFGRLLGIAGWTIALRTFTGLERALQKGTAMPSQDMAVLRQAIDSLFETTALLSQEALSDVVDAVAQQMRSIADVEEGILVLNRLVELATFNLGRLLLIWDRLLRIIQSVCSSDERGELRGAGATALCRILAQALRRGALALADRPEAAQEELLRRLEPLLRAPYEDVRARICEGLLGILQASGQELHPAAWGTMIQLVAAAARVELERAGLEPFIPRSLGALQQALDSASFETTDAGLEVQAAPPAGHSALQGSETRDCGVLQTVFKLLELLVHDFMEHVPPSSMPRLTASIAGFARFTGLGVSTSLTAVGFLWNVADALARYHCAPLPEATAEGAKPPAGGPAGSSDPTKPGYFEELWLQVFMHLRVLAVDGRPEVRHCAVKSLSSALLSHGRTVGAACYRRCLSEILIEVVAEIQQGGGEARSAERGERGERGSERGRGPEPLIVHHSRDTPEKQWDETMVLGLDGVRRVLCHYAEEAGPEAFLPLAYALLLRIQETLQGLVPETAGAALRALVDLVRIPAAAQAFERCNSLTPDAALPLPAGPVSVWLLGWGILWRLVPFCLPREVPENLVGTFASTLNALRSSHRQAFTAGQHVVLLQLAMVLLTAPSFYLPASTPYKVDGPEPAEASRACRSHLAAAVEAVRLAGEHTAEELAAFEFVKASPEVLWNVELRASEPSVRAYTKAPVRVHNVVEPNQSRNLDVWSVESALREVHREPSSSDEVVQAFLGPSRSPTHRTMLHISSARLHHVQGFVFGLLEDTPGFPDPRLELLFLCQCAAVFLDGKVMLRDSNKLALAARTLCMVVLFCRRILIGCLGRPPGGPASQAAPAEGPEEANSAVSEHLEVLLGQAVPHLFEVIAAVACGKECPGLFESGLWKLALEVLIYLIEDTLPALERCNLTSATVSAYWDALVRSLTDVITTTLRNHGHNAAHAADENVDLLAQATGNLIAYRLLASSATPPQVAERAVHWLEELAELQSGLATGGTRDADAAVQLSPPSERANLRHLFDLCACTEQQAGPDKEEDCNQSVIVLSARDAGGPRIPARFTNRAVLLGIAAPALVARVRMLFISFTEEEQQASPGSSAPPRRTEDVLSVLGRLRTHRADQAACAEAFTGMPARARNACELAGSKALVMALLPQLSALTTSSNARVRRGVREVLEGLASELSL